MQDLVKQKSKRSSKTAKSSTPVAINKCEFCNRTFSTELYLINHVCEKKRRWFQKDQPQSRIAFLAWSRFYELNSRFKKNNATKSFKEFIDSRYYSAFSKFARHVIDLSAPAPERFIDYVIKNSLPIDKWTSDVVYEEYIKDLLRTEPPEYALERSIILMQEWGSKNEKQWYDFFREVNVNQLIHWIKTGKMSPWVLYNANSAADMLARSTPEQINIIMTAAPVPQWDLKFKSDKDGVAFIKSTLKKAGL